MTTPPTPPPTEQRTASNHGDSFLPPPLSTAAHPDAPETTRHHNDPPPALADLGSEPGEHGAPTTHRAEGGPFTDRPQNEPGDRPRDCRCAPMLRRLEAIYASEGAPTLHTPPAADLRYTELYRPSGPPLPIALTGRGRHYLYRLHTRDGLGYVGIADDYNNRLNQHALEKAWWPEIRLAHVHGFATRDEAYRMESFVIRSDRPPFNLADGPVWSYMQALVQLAEREQAAQKEAAA